MKKQIMLSLIAASLIGVSTSALGDDDRERNGGWRLVDDDIHWEHDNSGRGGHKGKGGKHTKIVIKEKKHGKHKHKHKHKKHKSDRIVVINEPAHHRHGRHHGRRGPKFAEVVRVKPIRKVTKRIKYLPAWKCRFGGHSHGGLESAHSLELALGGLFIQANKQHDCKRIVKEVDTEYRVTYRYKGTRHVVYMDDHPGDYVRVNRFGELIHG